MYVLLAQKAAFVDEYDDDDDGVCCCRRVKKDERWINAALLRGSAIASDEKHGLGWKNWVISLRFKRSGGKKNHPVHAIAMPPLTQSLNRSCALLHDDNNRFHSLLTNQAANLPYPEVLSYPRKASLARNDDAPSESLPCFAFQGHALTFLSRFSGSIEFVYCCCLRRFLPQAKTWGH